MSKIDNDEYTQSFAYSKPQLLQEKERRMSNNGLHKMSYGITTKCEANNYTIGET